MHLLKLSLNKKLIKLAIIILISAFIAPVAPFGITHYVHAAGTLYFVGGAGASDSNPGTPSQPFATIQKAANVAVAGDTINIRTGIYRETILPANSGTAGNPIVYQPDGAAVVTVSGADIADGGWSVHSGNIYKKTIAMTNGYNANMTNNTTLMANQVFVNSKMMIEARWPNLPDSDDLFNRNNLRDGLAATWSTSGTQTLTDASIPSISGGWAGGTIWTNGWFISQTRNITASTGSQLTLSGGSIAPDFRKYYYLTGKLGALDVEKEWFYDGTELYLWQSGGGTPSTVEVKKRNYAFDLSNRSYITIQKINLFAASITTNTSSTNITLDGLNAKYINHDVTLTDSDVNYSHTGQVITNVGAAGIRLMGANSIIKNSEVAYSSNMGIVLGAGNIATNNLVHDIDYDGSYASAIAPVSGTAGQQITYNTIYRTGRSSIDLRPPSNQNLNIGYNDMYHYGMLNMDMGAIYSWGDSNLSGTRVHHNWIHDSKALLDGQGIQTGIYFDQGAGPVQSDHNVLWNNMTDYYDQHAENSVTPQVFTLYNNTFGSTNYASYVTYQNGQTDILTNNIYRDEVLVVNNSTHSLNKTTYPEFLNEGNGGLKYRLKTNSPAVDTGAEIAGVTDGFKGSAPDIGAYESGDTDWIPGYSAAGYVPGYYATELPIPTPAPTPTDTSAPGTVTVNDDVTGTGENQYEYVGAWSASANTEAYLQTDHYDNAADDYYQIRFTGSQVKVYGEKNASFGIIAVSVDGGPETLVDLYSSTRVVNTLLYASSTLTNSSHIVKVRVTGTKNASSNNTYTTADRVVITTGIVTINDDETGTGENQYEYVGSWSASANTQAYMQTDHYDNVTNDYYQIRFTGSQVKVYGEKNSSFGIVAVSVDGGPETLVDLYSATRLVNTLLYTSPTLANSGHTVKVRITGTKNASSGNTYTTADRVVVTLGVTPPPGTVTVNDDVTGTGQNQYEYVGAWSASANPQAYLETDHYDNAANDYYQIRFTGSQIKVYGEKNSSFGIAAISIDGGAETLVDSYSEVRMVNTLLYTSPVLAYGSHTVKVRITGTKNANSGNTYITSDRVVIHTGSKYEAENALLTGGAVAKTDHTGYSGTGFAGGFENAGAAAAFAVNAATEGSKDITLRYANDSTSIVSVFVNEAKIRQISLPATGGFDSWSYDTQALTLNAGDNTITYKYDTSDTGAVNLDFVSVPIEEATTPVPTPTPVPTGSPTATPTPTPTPVPTPTPTPEPVPDPGTKYEAEDAALANGAAVNTDHTDYSGAGFVGGYGNAGALTTFTVNAATAGNKDVTLRYANGNNTSSLSVYVNGVKINQISLPGTGSWDAWGYKTANLALNAGNNTITYKYDADDIGAVNLDYIKIAFDVSPAPEPGTKYEAESAELANGASINTDHTDYSGAGFVDGYGNAGATTTFTLNLATAGNKDISLRYANGNNTSSLSVYVNGVKIKRTALPGTGSWDTWGYKTNTLTLQAGVNTIAYKFDAGDIGAVNLDYISIPFESTPTPTPSPTPTPTPTIPPLFQNNVVSGVTGTGTAEISNPAGGYTLNPNFALAFTSYFDQQFSAQPLPQAVVTPSSVTAGNKSVSQNSSTMALPKQVYAGSVSIANAYGTMSIGDSTTVGSTAIYGGTSCTIGATTNLTIYGDVVCNGPLVFTGYINGLTIHGNVIAAGGITFNSSVGSFTIDGSLSSQGSVAFQGSNIAAGQINGDLIGHGISFHGFSSLAVLGNVSSTLDFMPSSGNYTSFTIGKSVYVTGNSQFSTFNKVAIQGSYYGKGGIDMHNQISGNGLTVGKSMLSRDSVNFHGIGAPVNIGNFIGALNQLNFNNNISGTVNLGGITAGKVSIYNNYAPANIFINYNPPTGAQG
ncbi:CBM35 domain-containing protein [Paenibacillus psychroresistens]|nr:CBM35 domain-containing protein [Paenibacillus psychroresistens]